MRGRCEPLPRCGASRSRRRSGNPYVVSVVALSGCIGASVAVTHVLPASESDEVPDLLCSYIAKRRRGSAATRHHRCGCVVHSGRAVLVADAYKGLATGARRNKIHMVLRHLPKRDVGIVLGCPVSRLSA